MAVTLTIAHNIFLTRDQRYAVVRGNEIQAVGVGVPVWVWDNKTSEPATEVFAKYKIKPLKEGGILMRHNKLSYTISMPIFSEPAQKKLPPEIWDTLSGEDRSRWLAQNEPPPALFNLLDVRDGGSEWLAFRQYSKIRRDRKTLNLVHFVEMKDISELTETLE